MVHILITHNNDLLKNFYSQAAVERMRALGEVTLNDSDEPLRGESLTRAARGFEIIVSDRLAPAPAEVLDQLPDLVALLRCAVDIRNIDVDAASRNGILVVRCSAGYAEAVAEVALGLVITLARRMHIGDRLYKAGEDRCPMVLGRQLAGASIGIIGYGVVGRRIAEMAIAFRMAVSVCDPYVEIVNGTIRQVDFDSVLSTDFVVCAACSTAETVGMMNRAAFTKMRPDAFFINVARGNLVDEEALEDALISGQIAGAGLDVGLGPDEQPTLRIATLPNVVAVPHIAGLTPQASEHQAFETVRQVQDLLRGKVPPLAVNADRATRLNRLRHR